MGSPPPEPSHTPSFPDNPRHSATPKPALLFQGRPHPQQQQQHNPRGREAPPRDDVDDDAHARTERIPRNIRSELT